MRRRDFITLVGGAVTWPLVTHGQQPKVPLVGFLGGGSPELFTEPLNKLRLGLTETGYIEGQNIDSRNRLA